jgi:hypothetical protein
MTAPTTPLPPIDADAIAARFLALAGPKTHDRTERALRVILEGYTRGALYNADYEKAKFTLSSAVDTIWHLQFHPYLRGQRDETAAARIVYELHLMGLHDCLAAAKKYPQLRAAEPDVDPAFEQHIEAFFAATVPLALIMKALKGHLIKGRQPNPAAEAKRAARLADQTRRTCPCCFRNIAVLDYNGLMADHGYTLPSHWYKTGSCYGLRFPPLERSNAGLHFMINLLTQQISDIQEAQRRVPELTSLTVQSGFRGDPPQKLVPGDPGWARALDRHVHGLERDLQHARSARAEFEQRLATWQRTE